MFLFKLTEYREAQKSQMRVFSSEKKFYCKRRGYEDRCVSCQQRLAIMSIVNLYVNNN